LSTDTYSIRNYVSYESAVISSMAATAVFFHLAHWSHLSLSARLIYVLFSHIYPLTQPYLCANYIIQPSNQSNHFLQMLTFANANILFPIDNSRIPYY